MDRLYSGNINGVNVEITKCIVYRLAVDGKIISYSNSLDNIHGDLFECMMTYIDNLSVDVVNKLFYGVYLVIDIVKQGDK